MQELWLVGQLWDMLIPRKGTVHGMGGHVRNLCESTLAMLEGPGRALAWSHSTTPTLSACIKKLMALMRGNHSLLSQTL